MQTHGVGLGPHTVMSLLFSVRSNEMARRIQPVPGPALVETAKACWLDSEQDWMLLALLDNYGSNGLDSLGAGRVHSRLDRHEQAVAEQVNRTSFKRRLARRGRSSAAVTWTVNTDFHGFEDWRLKVKVYDATS